MPGPLQGIRIVEFAGLGPGPFCGMMLADQGAEVICIQRPGTVREHADILGRSKRSLVVDLKSVAGIGVVRDLVRSADALIEGFRPGVMERLGLGAEMLLADNPRLVYGRMTGWGQDGPLAPTAGHDINYIAVAGALHAFGQAGGKPIPPINMVGDFGGGGMLLAFGITSALLHAKATGQGQVVDSAMVDGAAALMSMIWSFRGRGTWRDERGVNLLDGGAHFYDSYECADGRHVAVGAIEPQFYALLRRELGIADDPAFDDQGDRSAWPALKEKMAALFSTRSRDEWAAIFAGSDACVSPILSMAEAPAYPHNMARESFVTIDGIVQPAPAPRYSRTPLSRPRPAPSPGSDSEAVLAALGYDSARIAELADAGAVG